MTNSAIGGDAAGRAGLQLCDISKRYRSLVLEDTNLAVAPGEVLALTGPSGAGKTTMLRIIAGLEHQSTGTVAIGGGNVDALPPGRRRVALMFESYALYPHLSVRENVESPLRAPNFRPASTAADRDGGDRGRTVDAMLALLDISDLAGRLPAALSGGQKQRVALARTLVQHPSAFLLDEPISHLDAKLRHRLRGEVRRRLAARDAPAVWATPDGMEALSVGDRIAVIQSGRIEQIGTPRDIWERPQTTRVAQLIGDPPMNLIAGALGSRADAVHVVVGTNRIALPPALARAAARARTGNVTLGVRPDALALTDGAGVEPGIEAAIYANEPFGKYAIVTVALENGLAKIKTSMTAAAQAGGGVGEGIGRKVKIAFPAERLMLFEEGTGRVLPATP